MLADDGGCLSFALHGLPVYQFGMDVGEKLDVAVPLVIRSVDRAGRAGGDDVQRGRWRFLDELYPTGEGVAGRLTHDACRALPVVFLWELIEGAGRLSLWGRGPLQYSAGLVVEDPVDSCFC